MTCRLPQGDQGTLISTSAEMSPPWGRQGRAGRGPDAGSSRLRWAALGSPLIFFRLSFPVCKAGIAGGKQNEAPKMPTS